MSVTARRARQRERRENTRLAIMRAAERFLREHPFRDLSVDGLMAEVGLTRTAFYRHFEDTTDLVLRLLGELIAKLYPVAERWRATAGESYPNAAREGLAAVVDFFVAEGPLLRAIVDAAVIDDRIELAYRGVTETFVELTAQTLDRLAGEGRLESPNSRALARALNLMNESYLLAEFGREPFGHRDVALRTVEQIWLGAVGPLGQSGSG
jgi:AcrR family transcriptional regulator